MQAVYFPGQPNPRAPSLSGVLFFGDFSHCELGIMTCCLLDNNLKLMLTIDKNFLNEMLHVLASCINGQIIGKWGLPGTGS